jgi:hypothetical protein
MGDMPDDPALSRFDPSDINFEGSTERKGQVGCCERRTTGTATERRTRTSSTPGASARHVSRRSTRLRLPHPRPADDPAAQPAVRSPSPRLQTNDFLSAALGPPPADPSRSRELADTRRSSHARGYVPPDPAQTGQKAVPGPLDSLVPALRLCGSRGRMRRPLVSCVGRRLTTTCRRLRAWSIPLRPARSRPEVPVADFWPHCHDGRWLPRVAEPTGQAAPIRRVGRAQDRPMLGEPTPVRPTVLDENHAGHCLRPPTAIFDDPPRQPTLPINGADELLDIDDRGFQLDDHERLCASVPGDDVDDRPARRRSRTTPRAR